MTLSPALFARFGFALLAFSVALGLWLGQAPWLGWAALPLAGVVFLILTGLGEWLFRRLATEAERRADLEERVRAER